LITGEVIGAFYTPPEDRTDAQNELLKESDRLINEVKESDVIVMGIPIYNFSVPGSVKAYIDLISRTGVTFSYDDMGQVTGLLADKKVYIIVASGGTVFKSEVDFVSDYMKHMFSFWGITDVHFIDVTQQMTGENILKKANETIANYSIEYTNKA
jgi:FMN-dependent NADH-azoreductase